MNDTNEPNTEIENAEAVADALAEWWHASARDLPWRFGRTTAWGVLVSEVMSQQTQMSRVVPYWNDWMERWPDAVALADAAKADVITAWGRLGYPRRALRLQECARVVASDYDNKLPRTYDELLALPGIGDYTASAVMSFAFGEAHRGGGYEYSQGAFEGFSWRGVAWRRSKPCGTCVGEADVAAG